MKKTADSLWFNDRRDFLSMDYPCSFTYKDKRFTSVTQFLLYSKAKLFNCHQVADRILASYGRKQHYHAQAIKVTEEKLWHDRKESFLFVANREKFTQSLELFALLLNTEKRSLYDCSGKEHDFYTGIEYSDSGEMPSSWSGSNLSGQSLMNVRHFLSQPDPSLKD